MRDWKYATGTESSIRSALLNLLARKSLADITVSELAREAHVSRSTFYEHFGNPGDAYDALVADVMADMAPLMSQVVCSDGFRREGRPFCALVRDAGEYAPAVRDSRFLDSFLSQGDGRYEHDLYDVLIDAGYDGLEAQAVCSFQMSGCFAAARSTPVSAEEWERVRGVIDRFILGGIAACLANKKSR